MPLQNVNLRHAVNGLREAVRTQPHLRIELVVAAAAVAAGVLFRIPAGEWCNVLLCIGMVTAAECFNTAVEYLTDLVQPGHHPVAGKVKDLAAAAVLIASMAAAAAGAAIFLPRLARLF
jgi:diacylglycerol kinase (ATP)